MDKCLEKVLYNNDTMINERIFLIIDDAVFLAKHFASYNFIGGKMPYSVLDQELGTVSSHELEEELGFIIPPEKINLMSWFIGKDGCLKILTYAKIKSEELEIKRSKFVWETLDFTLVPLTDNSESVFKTGLLLEKRIQQQNQRCVRFISLDKNGSFYGITKQNALKPHETVRKEGEKYIIRLTENPSLGNHEKELIRAVNMKMFGYDDEKYVFHQDRICEYFYHLFDKKSPLSINQRYYRKIEDNLRNYNTTLFQTRKSYKETLDHLYNLLEGNKSINTEIMTKVDNQSINKHASFFIKQVTEPRLSYNTTHLTSEYLLGILGYRTKPGNTVHYHTRNSWYQPKKRLLFDDIPPYGYTELLARLVQTYPDSVYYQEMRDEVKKHSITNKPITDDNPYLNQMLVLYTKSRLDIGLIISFSDVNYQERLEKEALLGVRSIDLTRKQVIGLLYQIHRHDDHKNLEKLAEKYIQSEKTKARVILYENTSKQGYEHTDDEKSILIKDSCILDEIIEVVYNPSSLMFLEEQDLNEYLSLNNRFNHIILNTYKKWLGTQVLPTDRERFVAQSGMVLYVYGIRKTRDLDLIVTHEKSKKYETENFESSVKRYFVDEETRFAFGDVWFKDVNWRDYFDEWASDWAGMFGCKNFFDIPFNPKYHFHFMGIKYIILDAEIQRRIVRVRDKANANAVVDLIFIKERIRGDLSIPALPKQAMTWRNFFDKKTKQKKRVKVPYVFNKKDVLDDIQNILNKKYKLKKSHQEIISMLNKYGILKKHN